MTSEPSPSDATSTIDSHQHFWDLGRFDYAWMPPGDKVLRRNYLPDNLAPVLHRNGIERTVIVQAHQSVGEANFLLDLAEATDFVAGVVAWVDLTSPDVGAVLDELARRPKLVGIRHQVHDEADEAWLVRDDAIRGLREVARRDLAYDLLVRPQHLRYVPPLAEKVPDLRMVVDHVAKPLIADGTLEPWSADIAAVAAIPGIYCKVSGMVTEARAYRWSVSDLKPFVAHVIEQFGLERLMWGSDWPVCLLAATSYDIVLSAALDAVGSISDDDTAGLMGGNAAAFYRL